LFRRQFRAAAYQELEDYGINNRWVILMADSTNLFLEAFGGKDPEPARSAPTSAAQYRDSTELMDLAFGQDDTMRNYTAPKLVDYKMNIKACRAASPSKLLILDQAMKAGTEFRDLPMGLQDLVIPSRNTAKQLRVEEDTTGMTLEQRKSAFDALEFGCDYIKAMADAGLPAKMLSDEFAKLQARFPAEAVVNVLKDLDQKLLATLRAQEVAAKHEAEQAQIAANEVASEDQVRAELAAAAEAIKAMHPLQQDHQQLGSEVDE
jgi:hypothetical protein